MALQDLMGDDPLGFVAEVLEVEGFGEDEAEIIGKFDKQVRRAAAVERRALQMESHLDVVLECLKRKTPEEVPAGQLVGPLPGLRKAAAFRRKGPGAMESMADQDRRVKAKWIQRLRDVLTQARAPALAGVDPTDLNEYVSMLVGKARPGTIRIRVHTWEIFLRWLLASKGRLWPQDVADLVEYIRMMVGLPAAAYFPRTFASAVQWFGGRAGFEHMEDAGNDVRFRRAVEWAELELGSEVLRVRKAPRLPVVVLMALELKVVDMNAPRAIRVTAWYRLVKVYGGLRWDDLQRMHSDHMELKDAGLTGRMVRTKVSGPGRRVREVPLYVSRDADLTGVGWLEIGYGLWRGTVDHPRDYMIQRPTADMSGFVDKVATDVDATTMGQMLFASLEVPVMFDEARKQWIGSGLQFLPGVIAGAFTNHSERSTLVSALAAIGIDKERRSMVGRWSADGSDEYVRTYRAVLRDLTLRFVAAVRSGNSYETLDEEDAYDQMGNRLVGQGVDREVIEQAIGEIKATAKRVSVQWATDQERATPTEVASLPPVDGEVAKEEEVKDYQYLVVYTRGRKCARLHAAEGCWRARQMLFKDVELVEGSYPDRKQYNKICKECWPGQPTVQSEGWLHGDSSDDEEDSSTSSAGSGEGIAS